MCFWLQHSASILREVLGFAFLHLFYDRADQYQAVIFHYFISINPSRSLARLALYLISSPPISIAVPAQRTTKLASRSSKDRCASMPARAAKFGARIIEAPASIKKSPLIILRSDLIFLLSFCSIPFSSRYICFLCSR